MGIKAVAFDLDGTLLDSVPDLYAAATLMLADLKLAPCTEEQIRNWIGNGVQVLVERILANARPQGTSAAQVEQAQALFMQHYEANLNLHSALYQDVLTVLTELKQQGYRLAVVTNKPYRFTTPLLEHFQIAPLFDLVIGGDSLAKMKPDPLPLLHVLQEFAITADELLMVGDSHNDVLTAKAAGVQVIGLTYGYNYGEDIRLHAPEYVCDQFSQVTAIIQRR